MAAVVGFVALTRTPYAFQRSSSRPAAAVPVSSFPGVPGVGLLPDFRGLRVSRRPARLARAAARARGSKVARRGAVVCDASETTVEVPVVTKSTWQSLVIKSDRVVLVSFWAPWCGPCRMIHPVIAEIAAEYTGKLNCFELNTDENPDVATQYGIRSIPTVMFFKDGEKKDAIIGAVPKGTLVATLEKFL